MNTPNYECMQKDQEQEYKHNVTESKPNLES